MRPQNDIFRTFSKRIRSVNTQLSSSTVRLQDADEIINASRETVHQLTIINDQIQSITNNLTTLNDKLQELIIYLRIQRSKQENTIPTKTGENYLIKHALSSRERANEPAVLPQTKNPKCIDGRRDLI